MFLLDDDAQQRLKDDLAADQTSGRYQDMENVEDFVMIPALRIETKGPSPLGRKLELWAEAEYQHYFLNSARSHLRAGLGAIDGNGDGDALDNNARAFVPVDRSRSEPELGASFAKVERVRKNFDSNEQFDVDHRDREDTRTRYGVTLRFPFGQDWEGRLGCERTTQNTNRPADPDSAGEITDYSRTVIFFAVIYEW